MTWKQYRKYVTKKLKNNLEDAGEWCYENRAFLIGMIPVVLPLIGTGVEVVSKSSRYRDEKKLKERMVYDRKSGLYLETKRKLTNADKVEIDRRRKNGESLTHILDSMHLLK